jgi:hypothetical protein
MILWREKFRAFSLHFAATLVVALIAAALIFFVWYPAPFARMVGGFRLFLLVSTVDLTLGPLISLIIYTSKKSRRALVFDYIVIGVIQVAAFVYGVYSVSQARPAYVAFVKDRIEIIAAGEIGKQDLKEAEGTKYGKPSQTGPVLVATLVEQKDRNDALWAALEGRDVGVRPKFFVDYSTQADAIKRQARPLPSLLESRPESKLFVQEALDQLKRPAEDFGWLPVKHTRGFWTALIDLKTGRPAQYIPIDPY